MACIIDDLPDALLLLILEQIADAKTITRCAVVSIRFFSLLCHVNNVVLKPNHTPYSHTNTFSRLCGRILKKPDPPTVKDNTQDLDSNATQLKNFVGVKSLRIELPSPELGLENGSILKWSASFGSMLNSCIVLGATLVVHGTDAIKITDDSCTERNSPPSLDTSTIPESFYSNGNLKSRVVWIISSLIAASARHYSSQQVLKQHKALESLTVNDACGQGVLRMDKKQVEEVRAKQTPVFSRERSKREVVPHSEITMWYAERMEMGDRSVLKGVTLGVIRPKGKIGLNEELLHEDWVLGAFEEPFASIVKVMVKGRGYRIDMDSF